MKKEQKKIRKFYKEFLSWRPDTIGTWIGAGMLVMFLLVASAVPVQELLEVQKEDADLFGGLLFILFAPLAGLLYLRPYQVYVEDQFTQEAKNVPIVGRLKYLPVDFREIKRMKAIYLVKFYAKILPFAMLLQALTSTYSYGAFTWQNVVYIVLMAFVWPLATNLPAILLQKA